MSSYYEKILATGEVKCIDEEIPFEIPKGWEWCRICHVAEIARGGSPRPIKEYLTDATDGINWIKIGDTEKDSKYITSVKERIKQSGVSKSRMVHKGDFLLTNSMSFGRPYITQVDGCIHDGWLVISLIEQSYRQDFFYYLLSSGYAYCQFAKRVAGAVVQNLNSEKVAISLFPLPPYKEQNRIVQKIKDLLPLVEKFGNDKTLLDKLNADINTRLKKSILQEAIQGKLVPQIAEEGTAQELLEQIKTEKQKLVKEGKLKKSALNDSVIFKGDDNKYWEKSGDNIVCIDEDIPFGIPSSWSWCRLGNIASVKGGKRIPVGEKLTTENTGHMYIRVADMKENTVKTDDIHYISESIYQKIKSYTISTEDLYITVAGTIGSVGEIPKVFDNANLTENADKIVFRGICKKFLMYCLLSNFVQSQIKKCTTKVGQPKLAIVRIVDLVIPLPPIKEQYRIVHKIEQTASIMSR